MEFAEFAQKIKPIIGGSYSTKVFTKTLFESIITEEGLLQIEDISENTFKAYYNGQTKITRISQRILPYIDPEQFISYLENFPEATTQRLCDVFKSDIEDIDLYNANEKIAYFFEEILTVAAAQIRKSANKQAQKSISTIPSDKLNKKILAAGQVLAATWGKALENIANEINSKETNSSSMTLPEEYPSEKYPYSTEDKMLLQEFTSDYDEIMFTLIGENYADSLIDMTLPYKIKDLYETKWISKADIFSDPALKSYVFGLLSELNKISNSFLATGSATPSFGSIRTKIRNLYVKLHPDQFAESFPYDAFIDDWNDGEY